MDTLENILKESQSLNAVNDYQKVIELLTDTILENYNSAELYAEKALAFYWLKNYESSNSAADKALSINPNNALANYYKGNISSINQEYTRAIEFYNKAIEADPKFVNSYNDLGNTYLLLKNYIKAIEFYIKAIETDPKFTYPYYNLGITYAELKEYDKAIEFYNKAIDLDPKNAYSFNNLGNTYAALKEYDKAIDYYNKAVETDPKFTISYYNLGYTYHELKNYDKAIESYYKAIEVDPNNAYSYNGLGNSYSELKNYDKAIEFYNKAIKADPKYAIPYYNLGYTHYIQKKYDKAIGFYNKAIETDPNYAYSYNGLGNTYYKLKDYENSLVNYEKYVAFTKYNPDYYTSVAESRITELKKFKESTEYSSISALVNKIKDLLHFKKGYITHYTSLSVAKTLILDSDSLFRLSEGAFLNDTSEGRELFNYLSFHITSKKGDDTVADLFAQKPFIGSFVTETKHDDLTLWRMYGKEEKEEAKGCAITLDMENLLKNLKDKMVPDSTTFTASESEKDKMVSISQTTTAAKTYEEFNFYRVAYRKQGEQDQFIIPGASEKEEKDLNKYMSVLSSKVKKFKSIKEKQASDKQDLEKLLNEIAYLFKSAEYQHENELRLVIKGVGFDKKINTNIQPPKVYIELVSVRPLIKKITLGPKVERAEEWAAAFYYSLKKDNYQPDILISHLPFK